MDFWRQRIHRNDAVVSCGIPRTGSTVTWQILKGLFPNQRVIKAHPAVWEPTGGWIFATVRHPLDTAASRYRMRLMRARVKHEPESERIKGWTGMQAELHGMKHYFDALKNRLSYSKLIIVRYEEFFNDYNVIYDAIQSKMGRVIEESERRKLDEVCGLEANKLRSKPENANAEDFSKWQIHVSHIGTPEPGRWREVIPAEFHDRVIEFCRPLCKDWGYQI